MIRPDDSLYGALVRRGMSRRAFLRFSALMAATLALPVTYRPKIVAALESAPRLPLIWLRGQSCGGNTEAFLAATAPTTAELLLGLLSIEYHESLMAASGDAAVLARTTAMERYPDGYVAVVEGAVPTADGGMACTVGGRPFRDVVREVSDGAIAVIALGSCAFDGGTPSASGGPTKPVGVREVVGDSKLINLPGCPVNVENLTATIVNYLTFKEFPITDSKGRPLFAYGGLLHNLCERRAHYEFGEFALAWGDEGAQKGWCLYKLGCKGPETFANCPTKLYAERTSWGVKAGHGCIGCTMPKFWDAMGPAYQRLPAPVPFAPNVSSDQIGLALVGGVAAATVVHGAVTYARELRNRVIEHRRPERALAEPAVAIADEPAIVPTEPVAIAPTEPTGTDAEPVATPAGPAVESAPPPPEPATREGGPT